MTKDPAPTSLWSWQSVNATVLPILHVKAEEATCINAKQTAFRAQKPQLCMNDETCQNSILVENSSNDEDGD